MMLVRGGRPIRSMAAASTSAASVVGEAVPEEVDAGLQAGGTQLGDAAHLPALGLVIEMGEEAVALALADVERLAVTGVDVDVDV